MTRLVNNGCLDERRRGRMLAVHVGPTYNDIRGEYRDYLETWESLIVKTADLFMRMDTRQAEIAATVVFAAKSLHHENHRRPSEEDVLNAVMDWKQRRNPPFNADEVSNAIRNLAALNWLDVALSRSLSLAEESLLDM